MYRETFALIDVAALTQNVKALHNQLADHVQLMATVKADAYGHGVIPVSKAILAAGADQLGVATVEEAIELREAGIQAPILVYGAMPHKAAKEIIHHDLMQTVFTDEDCDALQEAAMSLGKKARVHVKIDTGMNRLGVKSDEEIFSLFEHIKQAAMLEIIGAFTHFTSSDEPIVLLEESLTESQRLRFLTIMAQVKAKYQGNWQLHASSSAGMLRDSRYHLDMVRPGISLYGYYPSPYFGQQVTLKPVMTLKTHVVRVHTIDSGEAVSYGCTYVAKKKEVIATLPIGYADGIPRGLSNRGSVSIRGQKAPIVGRVCMDQMMVLVTGIEGVMTGDEAVIYGQNHHVGASLEEAAKTLETITYELLCRVSKRIPRVYDNVVKNV